MIVPDISQTDPVISFDRHLSPPERPTWVSRAQTAARVAWQQYDEVMDYEYGKTIAAQYDERPYKPNLDFIDEARRVAVKAQAIADDARKTLFG